MKMPPSTVTITRAAGSWRVEEKDGAISWEGADIQEVMAQAGRYFAFAADQFDKFASDEITDQ